jgi:hypothetical protein
VTERATIDTLDPIALAEFKRLFRPYQDCLRANGVHDGYDLGLDWSVQEIDGRFCITDGASILEGITSASRDVIDALYADGVRNLNR